MNQPNKPQNPDSLHVGETVEQAAENLWMRGSYANDERGLKTYVLGAKMGANLMKDKLSEAGESKWIDVKDKLPSIGDNVILNHSVLGVISDKCVADGVHSSPWKSNSSYGVTHWQPLPSAPNETTNVATRSYTHEQVLAFGERVKQGAAILAREGTLNGEYSWKIGSDILSIDLNKIEIK